MNNRLPDSEYQRRADKLRRNTPSRRQIKVRDAARILELGSTSAANYTMQQMVERGLLTYEPPKNGHRYGKYFLEDK